MISIVKTPAEVTNSLIGLSSTVDRWRSIGIGSAHGGIKVSSSGCPYNRPLQNIKLLRIKLPYRALSCRETALSCQSHVALSRLRLLIEKDCIFYFANFVKISSPQTIVVRNVGTFGLCPNCLQITSARHLHSETSGESKSLSILRLTLEGTSYKHYIISFRKTNSKRVSLNINPAFLRPNSFKSFVSTFMSTLTLCKSNQTIKEFFFLETMGKNMKRNGDKQSAATSQTGNLSPTPSNASSNASDSSRKRQVHLTSPEDVGNNSKVTKQSVNSNDNSDPLPEHIAGVFTKYDEETLLKSDNEESHDATSTPRSQKGVNVNNNILRRLEEMEKAQRLMQEENDRLAAELWSYQQPFNIDDTIVVPPRPIINRVSQGQNRQPDNSASNYTLAQHLDDQQVSPSSIVITPVDYPNRIIDDKDVKVIEEAIGNILNKSEGQINLTNVIVEQVKYGVMFIRSQSSGEANKLAAMVRALPWAKFGLPTLQCISVRNFVSAPVCEIRIAQKGKSFDEVKLAAHNTLNISTVDWRLIKKSDAPSRRGCSFILVCDQALVNKVLDSPREELKFNFGFSHFMASISIPISYKVTRKLKLSFVNKLFYSLAFKVVKVITQDSTSRMKRWIESFRMFSEDPALRLKAIQSYDSTYGIKMYFEFLRMRHLEFIWFIEIKSLIVSAQPAFIKFILFRTKCPFDLELFYLPLEYCNPNILKSEIKANKSKEVTTSYFEFSLSRAKTCFSRLISLALKIGSHTKARYFSILYYNGCRGENIDNG